MNGEPVKSMIVHLMRANIYGTMAVGIFITRPDALIFAVIPFVSFIYHSYRLCMLSQKVEGIRCDECGKSIIEDEE